MDHSSANEDASTTTAPPGESASPTSLEGRWVHRCLLTGVLISGPLLLLGMILTLAHRPEQPAVPQPPRPIATFLRQATAGDGIALIQLGLLALMITPIVRVAMLAVLWTIKPGAKHFAAIAATVLLLLALSVALSFR